MATFATFRDVPGNSDGVSLQAICVRPRSQSGSVCLQSRDPRVAPRIDLQYFAQNEDLVTLREGVKLARRIVSHPASALRNYVDKEVFPGADVQTDAQIDDYIRQVRL